MHEHSSTYILQSRAVDIRPVLGWMNAKDKYSAVNILSPIVREKSTSDQCLSAPSARVHQMSAPSALPAPGATSTFPIISRSTTHPQCGSHTVLQCTVIISSLQLYKLECCNIQKQARKAGRCNSNLRSETINDTDRGRC